MKWAARWRKPLLIAAGIPAAGLIVVVVIALATGWGQRRDATLPQMRRDSRLGLFPSPAWIATHRELVRNLQREMPPVLFLGDSHTSEWQGVGRSVWDAHFRALGAMQAGIGGDTTENLLWRIAHMDELASVRLVIVCIGANNLSKGDSPETVVSGVRQVAQSAAAKFPKSRILVIGVPPRADGDPRRERISAVNNLLAGVADGKRVFYHACDAGLSQMSSGEPERCFRPDRVHLTADAYDIWAREIAPQIRHLLE